MILLQIYRLQVRPVSWWRICLEGAAYVAVNVLTVALFLWRPFVWEHAPEETQRFMW